MIIERNIRKLHELGPLQLEIMDAIWKGAATVHQVVAAMTDPPNYITVLTVLRRMRERGLVNAEKVRQGGGPHQFQFAPAVTREAIQDAVLTAHIPFLFPTWKALEHATDRLHLQRLETPEPTVG
jgi:predicted transcriptional regulator